MTNLERLLQELCPGGVPYRTLGELQQIFFVERVLPVNRFVKKEHLRTLWRNLYNLWRMV